MQDYSSEVHAYTRGLGHLTLELSGYDVCHNSEEVIAELGMTVKRIRQIRPDRYSVRTVPDLSCRGIRWMIICICRCSLCRRRKPRHLRTGAVMRPTGRVLARVHRQQLFRQDRLGTGSGLQQIYAREFGMSREDMEDQERRKWLKKKSDAPKPNVVKYDKKAIRSIRRRNAGRISDCGRLQYYFAWKDLNELSRVNIDSARDRLLDILSNYQGYKSCPVLVVFDAYKRKGTSGCQSKYHNLDVVYTKTDETADAFIERTVHEIGHKYRVTVATNDGLEQLTVMSQGRFACRRTISGRRSRQLSRLEYENYLASQKR